MYRWPTHTHLQTHSHNHNHTHTHNHTSTHSHNHTQMWGQSCAVSTVMCYFMILPRVGFHFQGYIFVCVCTCACACARTHAHWWWSSPTSVSQPKRKSLYNKLYWTFHSYLALENPANICPGFGFFSPIFCFFLANARWLVTLESH